MSRLLADPEFWVLVAALIFAAGVWKPARQALIGALDARAEAIRRELETAQTLREEAERLLAEHRRKEQDAVREAAEIIAHAKAEAERIATQSARDLEDALQRRQRLAEERIVQAEAKALAEIRAVAVDIAIAAARQFIAAELDEARGAALIDAAIGALPSQLH